VEFDVEDILREVRARVDDRKRVVASRGGLDARVAADLVRLESAIDPFAVPFVTARRVLGRPLVAIKRTFRRFLTPILVQQGGYNAANARLWRAGSAARGRANGAPAAWLPQ